jgi:flagellar biosynthetic protein FlhB
VADEDESQKTEEPTARKLEKAREEGDVPISNEVKNVFILLAALIIVWVFTPWMFTKVKTVGIKFIAAPHDIVLDKGNFLTLFVEIITDLFIILSMPIALCILLAVLGTISQIGFLYVPKKLAPKWEKLNIFEGLKNFINMQKIMEAGKGILKIIVVALVSFIVLTPKIKIIPSMPGMEVATILIILHNIISVFVFAVIVVVILIAALDLAFTHYQYTKKHKMTKQEIKDEYKESEGDPQVKARVRSIRMERFRQRMMSNVPDADVVITNPTHYSVALKYDMETMEAPTVVAKGIDFIALKIREIAEDNEVPLVENPPLARALFATVEVDETVPEEHYQAVAEVIRYVMELKDQLPN